jgi:hypothetical protein
LGFPVWVEWGDRVGIGVGKIDAMEWREVVRSGTGEGRGGEWGRRVVAGKLCLVVRGVWPPWPERPAGIAVGNRRLNLPSNHPEGENPDPASYRPLNLLPLLGLEPVTFGQPMHLFDHSAKSPHQKHFHLESLP